MLLVCRPPRGGRGLKSMPAGILAINLQSPPSRGAWIEILSFLRLSLWFSRRPPRGGRGLKYYLSQTPMSPKRRPPRGGRGLK